MILRRFTQHIKEQNWFAVGLDVIVVVVGIFLGMQVTEWNNDRQKRENVVRAFTLILNNLDSDYTSLSGLHEFSTVQEKNLNHLLSSGENISDSMLLDVFYATWSMQGHITIQQSGLDNLKSIHGVKHQSELIQEHLDKYYDATTLTHELVDWHLTNRRIDDFKWKILNNYKDLVLILRDPTLSEEEQRHLLSQNEILKTELQSYFKDKQLISLVADKFMMATVVSKAVKNKLKENQALRNIILEELRN